LIGERSPGEDWSRKVDVILEYKPRRSPIIREELDEVGYSRGCVGAGIEIGRREKVVMCLIEQRGSFRASRK
jgi:hypothetical protein